MKRTVFLALLLMSICSYAREYEVSGTDDNGRNYSGEIESMSGSRGVSGVLYDDYGRRVDIDGQWSGYKEIEASDNNGNSYTLETD